VLGNGEGGHEPLDGMQSKTGNSEANFSVGHE
jgi:hypothetical protein